MELLLESNMIPGLILSILLSVIAWFIKQLHADFKKVEQDLNEVKTTTQLIKLDLKSNYELVNQRMGVMEKRVEVYEESVGPRLRRKAVSA